MKELARSRRLRATVVELLLADGDYFGTLETAGYFDQAHFSHEFGGSAGTSLREFYRGASQPLPASRAQDVEKTVAATARIYRGNVFPEMNVTFGTYPNNIGHIDSPGCFRCHDDNHKTKDGKKIGQDCETCHAIE